MGKPISYGKLEKLLPIATANFDSTIKNPEQCSAMEIRVSRGENADYYYDYIILTPSSGIYSCRLNMDQYDIEDSANIGPVSASVTVTYVAPTSAFPVL